MDALPGVATVDGQISKLGGYVEVVAVVCSAGTTIHVTVAAWLHSEGWGASLEYGKVRG